MLPQALTGPQLPKNQTQAVEIAADADTPTVRLLGGHIGRRATPNVGPRHRVGHGCQAKVEDAGSPLAVQHHVGGLEVAVEDTLLVNRPQPLADLQRDLERPLRWRVPDPPPQAGQMLPQERGRDRTQPGITPGSAAERQAAGTRDQRWSLPTSAAIPASRDRAPCGAPCRA